MEMEKILEIIRDLVPGKTVTGDTKLIEDEIIDSFDLVALVGELNDAFNIQIGVNSVTPENFETPAAILALVKQLKN